MITLLAMSLCLLGPGITWPGPGTSVYHTLETQVCTVHGFLVVCRIALEAVGTVIPTSHAGPCMLQEPRVLKKIFRGILH